MWAVTSLAWPCWVNRSRQYTHGKKASEGENVFSTHTRTHKYEESRVTHQKAPPSLGSESHRILAWYLPACYLLWCRERDPKKRDEKIQRERESTNGALPASARERERASSRWSQKKQRQVHFFHFFLFILSLRVRRAHVVGVCVSHAESKLDQARHSLKFYLLDDGVCVCLLHRLQQKKKKKKKAPSSIAVVVEWVLHIHTLTHNCSYSSLFLSLFLESKATESESCHCRWLPTINGASSTLTHTHF